MEILSTELYSIMNYSVDDLAINTKIDTYNTENRMIAFNEMANDAINVYDMKHLLTYSPLSL